MLEGGACAPKKEARRLLVARDSESAAANGVIHSIEDLHLPIDRRRDGPCLDCEFELSGRLIGEGGPVR